jgi:hypothetical protein
MLYRTQDPNGFIRSHAFETTQGRNIATVESGTRLFHQGDQVHIHIPGQNVVHFFIFPSVRDAQSAFASRLSTGRFDTKPIANGRRFYPAI